MDHRHVTDAELLEYLAGNLSDRRAERIAELLVHDERLARRYSRLAGTWKLLGQWDIQAERDISDAVLAALVARRTGRTRSIWFVAARMAAAWLIAVALGVAGGLYTAGRGSRAVPEDFVSASGDEVAAEAMGLGELWDDGSGGLAESILQIGQQDNGEARQ